MTAATLVLEPSFEADLPTEQYGYRPGRNTQQAVVEVREQLFRGHREVVDAGHGKCSTDRRPLSSAPDMNETGSVKGCRMPAFARARSQRPLDGRRPASRGGGNRSRGTYRPMGI